MLSFQFYDRRVVYLLATINNKYCLENVYPKCPYWVFLFVCFLQDRYKLEHLKMLPFSVDVKLFF